MKEGPQRAVPVRGLQAVIGSSAVGVARGGADLDYEAGDVIGQSVLAREVAHGPIEGLDDRVRGLATMGPDDVQCTIGAKVGPVGANGLEDAVGQQQDVVAGLERDGLSLGEIGIFNDPQRRAVAAREPPRTSSVVPEDVTGRVPGVGVDQGARRPDQGVPGNGTG